MCLTPRLSTGTSPPHTKGAAEEAETGHAGISAAHGPTPTGRPDPLGYLEVQHSGRAANLPPDHLIKLPQHALPDLNSMVELPVNPDFIYVRDVGVVHRDSFNDALQPYSLDDLANPGYAKMIAKSISKASEQTRQILKARGQEQAFLDCQMHAMRKRLPSAPSGPGSGKEPATSSPVVKSMPAFGSLVSISQLWQIWEKGDELAKGNPIKVYKDIAKRGLGFDRKRFHEWETVANEVKHLSRDKDGDCIAAAKLLETERQRLNLKLPKFVKQVIMPRVSKRKSAPSTN